VASAGVLEFPASLAIKEEEKNIGDLGNFLGEFEQAGPDGSFFILFFFLFAKPLLSSISLIFHF
jgi:hypothetical protein